MKTIQEYVNEIVTLNHQIQMVGMTKEEKGAYQQSLVKDEDWLTDMFKQYGNQNPFNGFGL